MNKISQFLWLSVVWVFLAGCSDGELSKTEAHQLLQQKYPRPIETFVYAGDAKYAKLLQDVGLDDEGLVVTKKTKKLGDSTGWVVFTDKAKPYFLETKDADKKKLVQKVKAGEEQLTEVVSIEQAGDGNSAIVNYTTKVRTTPFGKLIKLNDGAAKQRTAELIRYNDAWHLKEKGTP
jgi:hypothetical protein